MKVGTDGVILGAWVTIEPEELHALDIGCGTALIALMLAQRSTATIDAVEIDQNSAEQAAENIKNSKWCKQINIHNIDINNFNQKIKYTTIVCNPPFFNDSLPSPDKGRTTARHTVSLSYANLIKVVKNLLDANGRFSLILPTNESRHFEELASGLLYPYRRCEVRGKVGAPIKRIMSEYRLTPTTQVEVSEISIREAIGNDFTQEYRDITADFYLKF